MRTVIDATPLLGTRTGVGSYVRGLVAALPAAFARRGLADARVDVTTWTARGGRVPDLPAGVRQVGPRLPARWLRSSWLHSGFPQAELLVGATTVFHGTNFVSPPTRRAREVVTVHDLTYLDHRHTVAADSLAYRELVSRALARGATVLTPSEAVAAEVRDRYGLAPERVVATPLGVDAAWFEAAPPTDTWLTSRGLPRDYVVFVGSLDPRKNLPRLVQAHAAVRDLDSATPDLVLAGPAGRERDLTVAPGVHVTGWLTDDDLRSLVAGARLLALPSLDEGFGLPVLEALAAGRPVLTSRSPALLEAAGPHARPAAADDTDDIATALGAALREADGPDARTGRREWARRFTWAHTADLTVAAYLGEATP